MNYFEDVEIGLSATLGSHTFTRDEIIAFATVYDPQPFHLDEEAARRSPFGALCASGWHTAATWMKCLMDYQTRTIAEGRPVRAAGASPGFRNMRWLKPVYAGDTVTYTTEVTEKSASRSKPEWGVVRSHNTGTNQHGDLVFEFEGAVLVRRRHA